ncbi:hypothetical protein KAFR_0A04690 [Kazachstania africana CBS 2517]|uniref:Protein-serine/threonine kinase n=1 Tax=Kazachstania africana (strain ATCC 22294 / BCRC 22015 / CBS 2517 / CECT 1963 / NBRC 1671 / NRRL Y-8276) TaxID=1071382 RepID=H2ANF4_KAZAF|nr:hypothetical protein KAFR_0A04690 [Kazachstania africana CBS 2517]CCF55904.1 hypothetical protein KAFR_0A04690 [Kazachstania africana CBS 2517]
MTRIQSLNFVRTKHFVKSPSITQIPDFTKYSPTRSINEELAPYLCETTKAFPAKSKYVNKQHYYHNKNVLLDDYLKRSPHPVSLMQLAQYYDDSKKLTKQKVIHSGQFVKEELIVRIASKIYQLQCLPFSVVNNFHFVQVYESYYNIFERFRKFPSIRTLDDNLRFVNFTKRLLRRFNTLNSPHLVMGALECTILDLYPTDKMDNLLSELLRARISRRLIAEEHISITNNYMSGKKENTLVLGDIFQECFAKKYILGASKSCEKFIKDMYFENIPLPKLIIEGDASLKFLFLPTHLKYLFNELLRNIYEATMKDYIRKGLPRPKPIIITIIENEDCYIFRIADQAGGILYHDEDIWSFGKSKERARESLENFHKLPGLQTISIYDHLNQNENIRKFYESSKDAVIPLARTTGTYSNTSLEPITNANLEIGIPKYERSLIQMLQRSYRYKLGIGLAMCKVYSEYWNGDLKLHSVSGYGTDTILKLGNLMKNTEKLQLDKV